MNTAHKAELLTCGCRVIPATGDAVTLCARHACSPQALQREISPPVELPKDASGQGLKPLCPRCASNHIRPDGDAITCADCGARFAPAEIVGFGMSVNTKPRHCDACGAIVYGSCSCSTRVKLWDER